MNGAKTLASIFLLLTAFVSQADFQQALCHPYSIQNDIEAARAYKARKDHNEAAANLFQQGVDQCAQIKYLQSRASLLEATRLDPRCTRAYCSLGYVQMWMEQYDDAGKDLSKAIGIDSTQPIYFYRKALCDYSMENQPGALVSLKRALTLKPNDPDLLRLSGRCHRSVANGQRDAIDDFTKLINNKAYTVEALCERGTLYAQLGEEEKALQDFAAASMIKPDAPAAFLGRANIFYKQHKYKEALENYTAALVEGTDKKSYCLVQRNVCLSRLNKDKSSAHP